MKKRAFEYLFAKLNIIIRTIAFISISVFVTSCQKNISNLGTESGMNSSVNGNANLAADDNRAGIEEIPLSLTIYNPCCLEEVYFTGTIHYVENNSVIHTDNRDISGVGLTSGLAYKVSSVSVRNYQFDPNEYLATLTWSVRMMSETGCGYNVQFVVHVTRDDDGNIKASIHSGNFFCLIF